MACCAPARRWAPCKGHLGTAFVPGPPLPPAVPALCRWPSCTAQKGPRAVCSLLPRLSAAPKHRERPEASTSSPG